MFCQKLNQRHNEMNERHLLSTFILARAGGLLSMAFRTFSALKCCRRTLSVRFEALSNFFQHLELVRVNLFALASSEQWESEPKFKNL